MFTQQDADAGCPEWEEAMTGPALVSPSPDSSKAGGKHSTPVEEHMVPLLKHINESDIHKGQETCKRRRRGHI